MRLKLSVVLILATLFVCVAYPVLAQTAPAATETKLPLAIGAGFSGYNPEAAIPGHILGGTLWIDYSLNRVPSLLRGIGIEAEARDLNYGRSASNNPDLRQDTAEGGVIYSWPHFRGLRPYGKFLMGYGNMDQDATGPVRHHDSRTIYVPGAGVDYRVLRGLWMRGDYEYQWWPDMAFRNVSGLAEPYGPRHPQGFTIGVLYRFGDDAH
jgi:opacity protein-like surface antigen